MELYMSRILAGLFLLSVVVYAQEMRAEAGDLRVRVLGRSGTLLVWRHLSNGDQTMPIELVFEKLVEICDAYKPIANHSFAAFTTQDFYFTEVTDSAVFFGDASNTWGRTFTYSSTLDGLLAKLTVAVYLVKEDVVCTVGNQTTNITKGQVKVSLKLDDWQWCAPCRIGDKKTRGAFVDLVVTVMSRATPEKKTVKKGQRTSSLYDLGAGDTMRLSNMLLLDGIYYRPMPDGYPRFDGTDKFTFRFPRFSKSLLYDPIFTPGSLSAQDLIDGAQKTASVCLVSFFLALLVAIFQ